MTLVDSQVALITLFSLYIGISLTGNGRGGWGLDTSTSFAEDKQNFQTAYEQLDKILTDLNIPEDKKLTKLDLPAIFGDDSIKTRIDAVYNELQRLSCKVYIHNIIYYIRISLID